MTLTKINHLLRAAFTCIMISIPGVAAAQGAPENILQLVGEGKHDEARAALQALPHAPIDRLFLEAQIYLFKGQFDKAAGAYRAMLSEAPGLIPVRQALAELLLRMGDFSGARFHFERLREIDPRPQAREFYSRTIARIRQEEPSGISTILTLTPSTNINRGSLNTTFTSNLGVGTIDESGQEKSGLGITAGANGFYKIAVGQNEVVNLRGSAQKTFFSDSIFNTTRANLSASYIITEPTAENTLSVSVSRLERELSSDLTSYNLRGQTKRAISGPNILTSGATLTYSNYDSSETLSGPTMGFDMAWRRQISPKLATFVTGNLGRGQPSAEKDRFHSIGLGIGAANVWSNGWSTYVGLEGGLRKYDAIFTAGAPKREDNFLALRGSILNSKLVFRGFSPRLNCLAQANRSNISFYDYDVLECGVQFTQEF